MSVALKDRLIDSVRLEEASSYLKAAQTARRTGVPVVALL